MRRYLIGVAAVAVALTLPAGAAPKGRDRPRLRR